jgi:hypothetical protein
VALLKELFQSDADGSRGRNLARKILHDLLEYHGKPVLLPRWCLESEGEQLKPAVLTGAKSVVLSARRVSSPRGSAGTR